MKLTGEIEVKLERLGRVVHLEKRPNLVVNLGVEMVRDLMLNVGRPPNLMAVGHGFTSPTVVDTRLGSELYRKEFTRSFRVGSTARFQIILQQTEANFPSLPLSEAGLFQGQDAANSGTMYARVVFTPFVKDSNVTATLTWSVPFRTG